MGCPRPHDSPDPASPPRTWILSCGRLVPAPPPPPAGGGGVQRGGELGPPPRPTRGPPGATPHLGRAPPLLANSAGLPGRLRSLPLPVGRLCWGRGRNQPSAGRGSLGPTPRKTGHRPGGRPPRDQPHLSGQGRQCSRPQGLGVAGKGPVGGGGGQRTRASRPTH